MGKVSSTAAYLAVGFIVGLFAWLSGSQAATVEDAAKSEGEVVLYSSLNNEQIVTLVDEFKKKYPLIKRSEEHTSELQSRVDLVCRLLLEKKKKCKCR